MQALSIIVISLAITIICGIIDGDFGKMVETRR